MRATLLHPREGVDHRLRCRGGLKAELSASLLLNSRLLAQSREAEWDEESIEARRRQLIDVLLTVWPGPAGHIGEVIDARDKSQDWVEVKDLVTSGLLTPGTRLTPRSGSWAPREAVVRDDGMLDVDGQLFGSPSGAGRHVKGSITNGWAFWSLPDGRKLIDVRAAFRGERPTGANSTALPHVEWNEEDLADCASTAAPLTLRVLDYVAFERPDELLTGADFASIGVTVDQSAGVTGAMARKVYNDFERSNPPIEFVERDNRWYHRMPASSAAAWRNLRGVESGIEHNPETGAGT